MKDPNKWKATAEPYEVYASGPINNTLIYYFEKLCLKKIETMS